MVRLRKASGGCTVLGYTWATDGAVVDVADHHAQDLLRIPDGGFTEVTEPEPAPKRPVPRPAKP